MTAPHDINFLLHVDGTLLARHYVKVDDKLRILAAMKNIWGDRLTTIFVRQGHYALDPKNAATYPAADMSLERIDDLMGCELDALRGASQTRA
jgi:hypothetical protein